VARRRSKTFYRVKRLLKQLTGRDVWIFPQVRLSPLERCGDWVYCPTAVPPRPRVYSFGVEEDLGIDRRFAERYAADVFVFDPTPNTVEWVADKRLPDNIHFFPVGVAGKDGRVSFYPRVNRKGDVSRTMYTTVPAAGSEQHHVEVDMKTLRTIMKDLGHERIDVLKMDVEGAEYEVIDEIVNMPHPPKQIMLEFHHRFRSIGNQRTIDAVEKLNTKGYRIFYISATGREYSFIHDDATDRVTPPPPMP
jgi:FkbM family methyltransferase